MWTHETVWSAIDALASRNGLTTSGLAKRAGLDPTTFNPSKRQSNDGRSRWPSTESIAKILSATNTSLDEFFAIVRWPRPLAEERRKEVGAPLPVLDLNLAGDDDCFDPEGYPTGRNWIQVDLPLAPIPGAYALRLSHDTRPRIYRENDVVVVLPYKAVRPGDRFVAKTNARGVILGECVAITAHRLDLIDLNRGGRKQHLQIEDIQWLARIIWVSQ